MRHEREEEDSRIVFDGEREASHTRPTRAKLIKVGRRHSPPPKGRPKAE